jgi:hypothetical protein
MRCGRRVAAVVAVALDAGAQVVPAANYTDLWWNPSESGWGVSIVQHASNKMFAVWFTYDIDPPAGLAGDNPAFGLAAYSGSRPIRRQAY